MKRSEMRQEIQQILISKVKGIDGQPLSDVAQEILNKIEAKGMIPPNSYHQFKTIGHNDWAPEDYDPKDDLEDEEP